MTIHKDAYYYIVIIDYIAPNERLLHRLQVDSCHNLNPDKWFAKAFRYTIYIGVPLPSLIFIPILSMAI